MPEGERRLAAIMFTDMVGFTALAQKSEALAMELLEDYRNLVRRLLKKYKGNEIKTVGDAFLVEFVSALEAVNCSAEIQSTVKKANAKRPTERKTAVRIGIHLGDVIHDGKDVAGDAVNIALRIESLAPPGGICVSAPVQSSVINKVDYEFETLGTPKLKNVSTPIEVFRIADFGENVSRPMLKEPTLVMKRIAILPFANVSPDPNDEYFADGLTEELISTVSKISELSVISRTSVMRYRGVTKTAGEIGAELSVSAILEGSVRKAGEKLRITAQLVDTHGDKNLWSETYERELREIFVVQSDIATKIAGSLQVALLKEDKEKIAKTPTENMRAYALYLKGRSSWNDRSEQEVRKGTEYLKQAILEDPNFAMAYSDLAMDYAMMHFIEPAEQYRSETMRNATRALELDPSLSEAHVALGLAYEGRYQWGQAEEELAKAIELNPKNANLKHWYARYLRQTGRMEQAIEEWKKALELDPFSIPVRSSLGFALVLTGHWDEGLGLVMSAVELNESSLFARMCLGNAYAVAGMVPQTVEEARKISLLARELDFSYKATAASLFAFSGNREEAAKIQEDLLEHSRQHYLDPCLLGMIYAALGDETNAFEQLDKAVERKSGWVPWLAWFPSWKSIRGHPKFMEIAERVGIR